MTRGRKEVTLFWRRERELVFKGSIDVVQYWGIFHCSLGYDTFEILVKTALASRNKTDLDLFAREDERRRGGRELAKIFC